MPRPASNRLVLGSVSAFAMVAMLSACTQPASYAVVDLSGSYGSNSQTAQAYSPVTGQPVYQSVSLYGPQSFPDAAEYKPTAQYAALEGPTDRVASLGYDGGGFDTFGITAQPEPIPQYSPIASSPAFQEAELLASPEFQQELQSVDRAFIDTGPLDAPAPFAEAAPQPYTAPQAYAAPLAQAAPTIDVVPVEPVVESIEAYDTAYVPPNLTGSVEQAAPRRSIIEESALEPLAPPVAQTAPALPEIGDDYTTLRTPDARNSAPVSQERPRYEPWVAPRYGAEDDTPAPQAQRPTAQRPTAQAPAAPTRAQPLQNSGPDSDFTRAARDLLPQRPVQAGIPAPSAVQNIPKPVVIGGGMRVPTASTEYPRPYNLLRPGIWPELANPGQGLVEAPARTPIPQFASLSNPTEQSVEPIARASERKRSTYEIKRNDTLLTIAQQLGTTPEDLAYENGMTPEAAIYIGQKLILPKAPARVAYSDDGIPMIDVAEVAASSDASDIGGPSVPTIDSDTANAIMGREPIQRASIPVRRVTTFSDPTVDVREELAKETVAAVRPAPKKFGWPVHGEVYRLDTGQVEIDPVGNADVAASASGKVVHVERGPVGVLVVIEHDNGWRSLTVGLDYSSVRPGDSVKQGATIGTASREHRVRFELRDADAGVADVLAQLRG